MPLTRGAAHLACAVLLAVDVGARAVRLRLLLRGLRCDVSLRVAGGAIGVSDAAAAVTPMRLGGGPVQLAMLVRGGVPLARATSALGLEAVATYPAVVVLGASLAAGSGAAWWREAARRSAPDSATLALTAAVVIALAVIVAAAAYRFRRRLPAMPGLRAELALLARLPPRVAAAAVLLGAVHVLARVAVLPLLTRALPAPPSLGIAALGSFALLYGQLVAPTPSGAGVVDYLGAHGLAGGLGAHALWVLGWWRAYTTFGGTLAAMPLVIGALRRRVGGV